MNSDRNKKENRKALKIFIPIIICCGLIGGLIGYFSTTETVVDTAGQLSRFIEKVIYASTPYAIIIIVLIGIAASLAYYKSGARDAEASKNESESDEDAGYELYTVADEKLSKGMMVIGISEILSLLFFSVMIAYIEDYINEKFYIYMVTIAVFVIGTFVRLKIQQSLVDFQKMMNPEKRGSVFDFNFQKKWEESCDELEKLVIYKSAYKAYKTAMFACGSVFIIMMLCSFVFGYGPLPAISVGIIWLIIVISYYREAMRLGKDKINL